ncbi:MAG: hypothetical protein EA422_02415 [Gemmatimonadales bacterium]|nr:MAG: hypothetical protein EA422_02415 [Gemmatimonadales bacterium]
MESILWTLTFGLVGLWLIMGWDLYRSPIPLPVRWSHRRRRWLWLGCWVAAGLGGVWGPEIWVRSGVDVPRAAAGGNPAVATTTEIRTPLLVQTREVERDLDDQVLRAETRLAAQVPLVLLIFLVGIPLLRRRQGGPPSRRIPVLLTALTIPLMAGLMAGCGTGDGEDPWDRSRPVRAETAVTWDTLVYREIPTTDTLLFSADAVTAGEAGFWVLDRAAQRVAHLDWEGSLRWYAGRRGSGPGEFLNPRTLHVDPEGAVHVLDAANVRVTSFDASGRLVREIPLGELDGTLHTFALASDGIFGMLVDGSLVPVRVDGEGRVERGTPIPVPGVEPTAAVLSLQGHAVAVGDEAGHPDGRWIYAFTVGDGFVQMDGLTSPGAPPAYPEPIPFPGVVETQSREGNQTVTTRQMEPPTFAAAEVSSDGDRLAIRFFGETPERGRWMDLYEASSGDYLESLILPAAGPAAWWRDRVVLLPADPEISVLVLRPRRD